MMRDYTVVLAFRCSEPALFVEHVRAETPRRAVAAARARSVADRPDWPVDAVAIDRAYPGIVHTIGDPWRA